MKRKVLVVGVLLLTLAFVARAQLDSGELAAVLEVLEGKVEIQRVNTVNRIAVSVEAVVGVGDTIFTDADGRARITYFEDGVSTEILANSTYRIDRFDGTVDGDTFNISVSLLLGQTAQQLQRLLNPNSSYDIQTPSMTLAARGTVFEIRVEESGRAAMLVRDGLVDASAGDQNAGVNAGFGVRALTDTAGLSDVVVASTFEELDAALDGCEILIQTPDDVSLNVRNSPGLEGELLGYLVADSIALALGVSASQDWYRVAFDDDFGWVLSSNAVVTESCAGLRVFPDTHIEGESISLESSGDADDDDDTEDVAENDA